MLAPLNETGLPLKVRLKSETSKPLTDSVKVTSKELTPIFRGVATWAKVATGVEVSTEIFNALDARFWFPKASANLPATTLMLAVVVLPIVGMKVAV